METQASQFNNAFNCFSDLKDERIKMPPAGYLEEREVNQSNPCLHGIFYKPLL